ncbi:YolD-like family protein [Peribacillus huizhouensis]|uniref:YolD-like family protein n=1 Tax=Peribacillus huizhouensis TaxID=1501239 RepID=UPI0035E41FE4
MSICLTADPATLKIKSSKPLRSKSLETSCFASLLRLKNARTKGVILLCSSNCNRLEHVQSLKDALVDEYRIKQPILDEQELEAIGRTISESMEFNTPVTFNLFNNGFVQQLTGTTRYINNLNSQII